MAASPAGRSRLLSPDASRPLTHLRKVFAKLGIASRKQIRIALLDNTAATAWR
ncbi:unnamed protein product [[Actinomadura] parvosata subsp. kistnae]|nr:unnamed protein product [Actinomadura parvosata subsp. kistnae]